MLFSVSAHDVLGQFMLYLYLPAVLGFSGFLGMSSPVFSGCALFRSVIFRYNAVNAETETHTGPL